MPENVIFNFGLKFAKIIIIIRKSILKNDFFLKKRAFKKEALPFRKNFEIDAFLKNNSFNENFSNKRAHF